jgi:uncharacterized membrane protein HdeD (DUF308 family)
MLNPMASGSVDKTAATEIAKSWWILLVAGIVSVVMGIVILSINWTAPDLALVVAILFIVRGVLQAVARPMDGTGRGWNIFIGGLEILVGIAFVSWPTPTLHVLAIFIGAWIVVSGIFHIVGAVSARHEVAGWWLALAIGLIELVIGIALLSRPVETLGLAIVLVGLWSIFAGAFQIAVSFEVKRLPEIVGD